MVVEELAEHNATDAAKKAAEEQGVNLDDVEGTGAEGRITVRDVRKAASAAASS
jgi:pyruvate/2-oxoglutarate dehydrogenase complex dihydrolipoamide acyltransferase (E2) component